jgi:hypothetical protein
LTANDCALLNIKIQRRYRGGKPRLYLPWGSDADVQDAQHWKSASITTFNSAILTHTNYVVGQTWAGGGFDHLVNVSYYQGFKVVTSPTTGRARNVSTLRAGGPQIDNWVGAATFNTRIATQRRRQHFSL